MPAAGGVISSHVATRLGERSAAGLRPGAPCSGHVGPARHAKPRDADLLARARPATREVVMARNQLTRRHARAGVPLVAAAVVVAALAARPATDAPSARADAAPV